MAWLCQRCQKKIFAPRGGAYKYALEWKYVKKTGELSIEFRPLEKIKESAVVTHVSCSSKQVEGFSDRIRSHLKIPPETYHPMLI